MRNVFPIRMALCASVILAAHIAFVAESKASAGLNDTGKGADRKAAEAPETDLIDLNLATKEQLMSLPGIGETEARKIIAGRPYFTKTQLRKDNVISEEKFYNLIDKVTIDLASLANARKKEENAAKKAKMMKIKEIKASARKTPSGLRYVDMVKGNGPSPSKGKTVKVHYTGWLEDGTKFDSSIERRRPFTFRIGMGEVIAGWDEGVKSMKVGGKRTLFVPPKLGYGAAGAPPTIPPNATLIFEVELLDIVGD